MAIDFFKIIELIKDPDLRLKITQLYGENIELKEENHKLRQKIEKLNANNEIRSKLKFKDNHYYLEDNNPYCTKCWDSDEKIIRLHADNPSDGVRYFICPNCKTSTHIGEYIISRAAEVDLLG